MLMMSLEKAQCDIDGGKLFSKLQYSKYRLSISYPKCLWPEMFQVLEFSRFWNICVYIMRYLRDGTQI